jgi:hypothetical protein
MTAQLKLCENRLRQIFAENTESFASLVLLWGKARVWTGHRAPVTGAVMETEVLFVLQIDGNEPYS